MRFLMSVTCLAILSACGGGGGGGGSAPSPAPTPATNTAPTISDPGALSLLEGGTTVATISASDAQNNSLSFSIASGDDQDLFAITAGGDLSFVSAPDFESPADADTDNVYEVAIQVSDGSLTDTQALMITVTDAFEGRVVDAPISGATVFVDLNGNNEQDADEPAGVTDDSGFFNVDTFTVPEDGSAKVISKGGTDTKTGKALPDLALISDVPADITKPANVTPLTTVVASVDTPEAKAQVLQAMGVDKTPEELLTTDNWAAAQAGDEAAKAAQRVNQQVGLLLQTAATVADDGDGTTDISLTLAKQVATQISEFAVSDAGIDLTSAATLTTVLSEALAEVVPTLVVEAASIAAVASSVATVNMVVADPALDPLSDVATDIVQSAQEELQTSVADVVSGLVSVTDFETATDTSELFSDVVIAVDALDTDEDGTPDALDTDDDGDGVADGADAFSKDATETLDTDGDGIGNNADTDDDADGVLDTADAFPLDKTETLDTDADGTGNKVDTDDDGDGVADASDVFPLDKTETIDTDADGIGNNADTDDDADGVLDTADAFPLDKTETIDTDADGIGNNTDTDDDGDGVADASDAFPLDKTETLDTDADGIGNNTDTDDDGDGMADASDVFPLDKTETIDTDSDGIGNNADMDDDGDGVADVRDVFPLDSQDAVDSDGDGVGNSRDAFPFDALETLDSDGDGSGNNADPDDDGDGFADAVDAFPLQPGEWLDTDGDGIGNNADADDDGDGVSDSSDPLPLSAANAIDSDGDGVLDVDDVQPNDRSITKALQVDLTSVKSLGLGEAIDMTSELAAARFDRKDKSVADRLLDAFLEFIAPKAFANSALSAQTNAISWDENGNIVAASILSSETLFVAEANVSPDGKYVYLLTSAHIQRAIPSLDNEVCSMYRVELADMTFRCLLTPEQGDIEPKSLIPTQATDFARRGIAFRSDGAALMQGFSRDLPEGVDGGTASTTAWFMDSDGVVTPMPLNPPYYTKGVFWLTDDRFAVAEFANTEKLDAGMSQERFVIYSADTLQQVAIVVDGVTNFGKPMVRKGIDVYWDSHVLRGESLLVESSGGEGYPLLDSSGERMLFLIDYIQSQRDESIANSARNRIFSPDGSVVLPLSEGTADWYEGIKQSGTGTDIKYPPVGFSQTHLAYRKTYEPAEPIQTLAGSAFDNFTTYQLANGQGSVEIQAATDIFLVRPDADHTGDMTIDYEVRAAAGSLEARTLTISGQTIANWRADGRPRFEGDYLSWASPSAQREGFCVYEFATAQNQCVNFTDYQSLAVDMEYFREPRYDAAAVYPDGSGNAFPGIQNTLLVGDELRVFFKDSVDNTYYQAQAQVADFIQSGLSALTITRAVNGAGDSNIVSDAIDLVPAPYLEITDASLETGVDDSVTLDFGRSLSEYAALPKLSMKQGATTLQLVKEVTWSTDKRRAFLSYSRLGLDADNAVSLQIDGPLFLPNEVRRYRLASPLTFEVSGKNAFGLAQRNVKLGDYSPKADGLTFDTLDINTNGSVASIDARSAPLNKANLDEALSGRAFVTPTLSLPLSTLPVGTGAAMVAIVVTDGSDGKRDSGERQISVQADLTWSGDGLRGEITAPAQTVSASYETSSGATVSLEADNFSADVLRVAADGAFAPASLDVRVASLLQRFDALIPSSLVRLGDYHVVVTTDIPLVGVDGNVITQLQLLISITEDGVGTDTDGDGVEDGNDTYPLVSLDGLVDTDHDGIPDECNLECTQRGMTSDYDDDNDGIADTYDIDATDAAKPAKLVWNNGNWGETKWQ